MTRVLSPVLPDTKPATQLSGLESRQPLEAPKQDTREYVADMLRELSSIAAWAGLQRARTFIDAALYELESDREN